MLLAWAGMPKTSFRKNSDSPILENNTFKYNGVRFLGCSLWTDLFIEGEQTAVT
ncbi:hypothetical protein [Bathymodiolus platifrons methanotrophic gill symbiont]|uniref:hypothetical protein n=1 Tax=Bathymodiolus platifrons methanotrophic gill symbiont TaxID=113268 RepID=UPI001C8E55AD